MASPERCSRSDAFGAHVEQGKTAQHEKDPQSLNLAEKGRVEGCVHDEQGLGQDGKAGSASENRDWIDWVFRAMTLDKIKDCDNQSQ